MLRGIQKLYQPRSGPDSPIPTRRQTLLLRCGHFVRRDFTKGAWWFQVHCPYCSYNQKEWNRKERRSEFKRKKREAKRKRIRIKVEAMMVKKKASKKVVKKSQLKKTGKGKKARKGRGWYMPSTPVGVSPVVAAILEQFAAVDDKVLFENELLAILEKEVKPEGKKTVKKLMKGALRNMHRSGMIQKERDHRREEKEAAAKEKTKKKGREDDEEESEEEEEETPPAPKKKVLKKKK